MTPASSDDLKLELQLQNADSRPADEVFQRWALLAQARRASLTQGENVLLAKYARDTDYLTPVLLTVDPNHPFSIPCPAGLQTYSELLGEEVGHAQQDLRILCSEEHPSVVCYAQPSSIWRPDAALGAPGIVHGEVFEAEPAWRCLAWMDAAQSLAKSRFLARLGNKAVPGIRSRYYYPGVLEMIAASPVVPGVRRLRRIERIALPVPVLRVLLESWALHAGLEFEGVQVSLRPRTNYFQ